MKTFHPIKSASPFMNGNLLSEWCSLNDDDLSMLEKLGNVKKYKKKSIILLYGDYVRNLLFIQKGHIKIVHYDAKGNEKIMAYNGENVFLAEDAFFLQQPVRYNAVAISDVELLAIGGKHMREVISDSKLAYRLIIQTSVKNDAKAVQIEDLVFNDATCKVCHTLYFYFHYLSKINPDETMNKISQQDLASLCGCHRVTVTKAITKLKNTGIIGTTKDGHYYIEDWEKLNNICSSDS